MSEMFNSQQKKGILTELYCIEKFIEMGYAVSIPYGNANRYDLIVDVDGKLLKIQCKTATLQDNDSYVVSTVTHVATPSARYTKYYDSDQIDFIVSIIRGQMVVIPPSKFIGSRSRVFRTELPKYGTKANCNLIEDYTFEKIVIPTLGN